MELGLGAALELGQHGVDAGSVDGARAGGAHGVGDEAAEREVVVVALAGAPGLGQAAAGLERRRVGPVVEAPQQRRDGRPPRPAAPVDDAPVARAARDAVRERCALGVRRRQVLVAVARGGVGAGGEREERRPPLAELARAQPVAQRVRAPHPVRHVVPVLVRQHGPRVRPPGRVDLDLRPPAAVQVDRLEHVAPAVGHLDADRRQLERRGAAVERHHVLPREREGADRDAPALGERAGEVGPDRVAQAGAREIEPERGRERQRGVATQADAAGGRGDEAQRLGAGAADDQGVGGAGRRAGRELEAAAFVERVARGRSAQRSAVGVAEDEVDDEPEGALADAVDAEATRELDGRAVGGRAVGGWAVGSAAGLRARRARRRERGGEEDERSASGAATAHPATPAASRRPGRRRGRRRGARAGRRR